MGVKAPIGVTRAYYFAYPIGLLLSFAVYWIVNIISPPPIMYPLSEWHEPKDYVRPEERGQVIEGSSAEEEAGYGLESSEKGMREKTFAVDSVM
jgi:nucleobase:cation symporter-1, NCS1 family